MAFRIYTTRVKGKASGSNCYIPLRISKHLPASARYEAELVPEGVLLRFIGHVEDDQQEVQKTDLPEWCKEKDSADD